MSRDFASVLQEKYEEKNDLYSYHLERSQNDIIIALGGMHNILQLCLQNNPTQKYHINDEQIKSLNESLLVGEKAVSLPIISALSAELSALSPEISAMARNIKPIKTQKKDKGPTIYKVDATNNVYYKSFCTKRPLLAHFFYYKVAMSKYYLLFWGILMILLILQYVILHLMLPALWNYKIPLPTKEAIDFAMQIIFLILFLFPVFALNIDIVKETAKTFDFWFKMVQFVSLAISATVIGHSQGWQIWNMVALGIAGFIGFSMIIFIDAAHWKYRSKVIGLLVAVLVLYCMNLFVYLNYEDVTWDPLPDVGGNYTQISFKNLMMNSLSNFAMYTLKPFFSTVLSLYLNKELIKEHPLLIKSTGISSKPYFKWENDKTAEVKKMNAKTMISSRNVLSSLNQHIQHSGGGTVQLDRINENEMTQVENEEVP